MPDSSFQVGVGPLVVRPHNLIFQVATVEHKVGSFVQREQYQKGIDVSTSRPLSLERDMLRLARLMVQINANLRQACDYRRIADFGLELLRMYQSTSMWVAQADDAGGDDDNPE